MVASRAILAATAVVACASATELRVSCFHRFSIPTSVLATLTSPPCCYIYRETITTACWAATLHLHLRAASEPGIS